MLAFVSECGFASRGARDAQEGLLQLRSVAVDIILTDYALDPHRETGSWMLLLAHRERLLGRTVLVVMCTPDPDVRAPTISPRAELATEPFDRPAIQAHLSRASRASRERSERLSVA